MDLPSLAALTLDTGEKRQRTESDDRSDAERKDELETVVVNYIKPIQYNVGIGGALPPLPISNVVQKRMVCDANAAKELIVPTATLQPFNVYGRKTLLYHSFINACQPLYKGQVGDPGLIKWYAFEPTMSYNFLLEAMNDKNSVKEAIDAAEKISGCPSTTPDTFMDVYEVVEPVTNLMLFSDLRDGKWSDMGGHQPLLEDTPLCISSITKEMMEKSGEGFDPTVDPRSPDSELSFAKRIREFPFEDGTISNGWVRLNNAVPVNPKWFDSKDQNKRNFMMTENQYELMLNSDDHAKHLKHIKRVKIQPSFEEILYNVESQKRG